MAIKSRTYVRNAGEMRNALRAITFGFRQFFDGADHEAFQAAGEAAQITMDASIPLTPLDTGALRASYRRDVERTPGGEIGAIITVGGPDNPVEPTKNAPEGIVDYAVIVHENLENQRFRVGGPKFLQRGTTAALPKINAMLAKRMKDYTNKNA